MASFSQLFRRAWGVVFYSKKSFWTIVVLANLVNIVIFGVLFFTGYNPMNQADMERMLREIWPYVFYVFSSAIFGGISGFFTYQYVAQIFLEKNIDVRETFLSWKRIFPALGTLFCGILFGIGLYILLFLGILLGVGIGFLGFSVLHQLSGTGAFIFGIIGFVFAVFYGVFLLCAFCWAGFSFFTFSISSFFLNNVRYFDAMIVSMNMIHKRWWRTFGMILLLSLCMVIGLIPLFMVSMFIAYTNIVDFVLLLVLFAIYSIVGIFFYAFIFALYEDYKKNPVMKMAEKKIASPKKNVIKKRVSKTKK